MNFARKQEDGLWAVPYLPIDPGDVGRSYESIIRINSQSGKGGAAYIMDQEFGFKLPRQMQPGFGRVIQEETDRVQGELSLEDVLHTFEKEYLLNEGCYRLHTFHVVKRHIDQNDDLSNAEVEAELSIDGDKVAVQGVGNGPLDAFCDALKKGTGLDFVLHSYHEHALTRGSSSKAVAYVEIINERGESWWGSGLDTDIIIASIKALLSALNRNCLYYREQHNEE
jgi:2-isopropylmalate synthase